MRVANGLNPSKKMDAVRWKHTHMEEAELAVFRKEAERFMLCKAQAAVLLRWRGYSIML